jgi:hypothetical protein
VWPKRFTPPSRSLTDEWFGIPSIHSGRSSRSELLLLDSARYARPHQALVVPGRDTATVESVGAILDMSRGWGVYGRASRFSDLERELSKHFVVRITNATTAMDIGGYRRGRSRSRHFLCVTNTSARENDRLSLTLDISAGNRLYFMEPQAQTQSVR